MVIVGSHGTPVPEPSRLVKVSPSGQVFLPVPVREQLCIKTGDKLDLRVEGWTIVLVPVKGQPSRAPESKPLP